MRNFMSYLVALTLTVFLGYSAEANLKNKSNGEWVTISGKITNVERDSFKLKSKNKTTLVEMDDYDWDADGYKLVVGDNVVVTGRVDKDFLEKKKVEASSVYVKGINTYFYANSADEEDISYATPVYTTVTELPESTIADLKGVVTKVDGREFTLNTGLRIIKVDTDELYYNPMDNKGVTQIDVGDNVRVSGLVEDDFLEGKEIEASFVSEI